MPIASGIPIRGEEIDGKVQPESKSEILKGPSKEQIMAYTQWATTGLDRFHPKGSSELELDVDGKVRAIQLNWNAHFPKAAMKENKDIAQFGGIGMAWFLMSAVLGYSYVEQSEIGTGVDYCFMKQEPPEGDLNFLEGRHMVEVSGMLKETRHNTLKKRLHEKQDQIRKGSEGHASASAIVTLFSQPKIIKEEHK